MSSYISLVAGSQNYIYFLGVAFNEFCKPEFCSELKVQLDNYDIPLQYRSKNPGRTVGSHGEIQNHILKKIRKSILLLSI